MSLRSQTAEVAEILEYRIQRVLRWTLGRLRLIPSVPRGAEPTQRTAYFNDFELALRFDAIEKGVLPVVQALYELGANTKFSCEGHLLEDGPHYPYVACWLNPGLAETLPLAVEKALLEPLHYQWYLEREDSSVTKMACREAGKPGLVLTLRGAESLHQVQPVSGTCTATCSVEFIKAWVNEDLTEIARRLNSLELPRRPPAGNDKGAWLTRTLLALLLVGPLVLLNVVYVISYWADAIINVLCLKPLKVVHKWIRQRSGSRNPDIA